MKAKILTIGDELLIGQVIDSNSAWLGAQLEAVNIKVTEIRSIEDDEATIIKNLEETLAQSDVILITGGLGPTKDDVTKKAIANFLGVDLEFRDDIYERMAKLFKKLGITIKESHRSQAYVPEGCFVIENKMGTAQGMWMEKDGKVIISMPGVPYEMKYIMENGGLKKLLELSNGNRIYHRTIMTAGWGETMIEEAITDLIASLPKHIKIAYLPGLGRVRVRISSSLGDSNAEVIEVSNRIVDKLGNIVFGYDDIALEEALGKILIEKGMTIGTAESCTGGNIAKMITNIPGSSSYFQGSIIAYSNTIKEKLLDVSPATLKNHGAVSEETVKEMVAGAIETLGVDVAIATSGIAGPGGGTPNKPVGTIWMAVGDQGKIVTRKLQLTKNRIKNIEYTSIAALNMSRKFLLGE
jgi:nicotinamide-nucleotide amidase